MLKETVTVPHEKISKQVLENVDTVASMSVVQELLLREYQKGEKEEDELMSQIKCWMDKYPEASGLLERIFSKIKAIDQAQDKIITAITQRAYETLLKNRESNTLWKQYEPKGRYYVRAHEMPLFR
ncbi:MAG TPA: hypothetical protein PK584_05090 [Fervidobacterium sp.]|nr:hypothetical protein [Fervidobacterium sp.]